MAICSAGISCFTRDDRQRESCIKSEACVYRFWLFLERETLQKVRQTWKCISRRITSFFALHNTRLGLRMCVCVCVHSYATIHANTSLLSHGSLLSRISISYLVYTLNLDDNFSYCIVSLAKRILYDEIDNAVSYRIRAK